LELWGFRIETHYNKNYKYLTIIHPQIKTEFRENHFYRNIVGSKLFIPTSNVDSIGDIYIIISKNVCVCTAIDSAPATWTKFSRKVTSGQITEERGYATSAFQWQNFVIYFSRSF
jgi:hypothetical protein